MKRTLFAFLLFFLVGVTLDARAQDTAPSAAPAAPPAAVPAPPPAAEASGAVDVPPDVDPRNYAVAQELVKSFDMKSLLQGVTGVMMKTMVPMIDQENPGQGEKIEQIATDAVQKTMLAHMPDLERNKATVYAQIFTYPELEQLKKFYQSPVGQKMLQSTPEMMHRNAILDQAIMLEAVQEARREIVAELKKNGMKVPKGLGV